MKNLIRSHRKPLAMLANGEVAEFINSSNFVISAIDSFRWGERIVIVDLYDPEDGDWFSVYSDENGVNRVDLNDVRVWVRDYSLASDYEADDEAEYDDESDDEGDAAEYDAEYEYDAEKEVGVLKRSSQATFSIFRDGQWWNPTGVEKCFLDAYSDPSNPGDWWDEYTNYEGEYHYAR